MKPSRVSAVPSRRKQELTVFVVLTLVLAPVLAITTVGGYGLGVWVYQMFSRAARSAAQSTAPARVSSRQ